MQTYLKAFFGAVIAGLGAAQTALTATGHIDWITGCTIAIVTLTALGVVWGVPNTTPYTPPEPPAGSADKPLTEAPQQTAA